MCLFRSPYDKTARFYVSFVINFFRQLLSITYQMQTTPTPNNRRLWLTINFVFLSFFLYCVLYVREKLLGKTHIWSPGQATHMHLYKGKKKKKKKKKRERDEENSIKKTRKTTEHFSIEVSLFHGWALHSMFWLYTFFRIIYLL